MREMVSRSSFSWDQAGMTRRIASSVISTWATDFFFVINILVVNIAEPHVRTENGGLYTAPNSCLCRLVASSRHFPGTRFSDSEGMRVLHSHLRSSLFALCSLLFALRSSLSAMWKRRIKGHFREKAGFSKGNAIGTFGVR